MWSQRSEEPLTFLCEGRPWPWLVRARARRRTSLTNGRLDERLRCISPCRPPWRRPRTHRGRRARPQRRLTLLRRVPRLGAKSPPSEKKSSSGATRSTRSTSHQIPPTAASNGELNRVGSFNANGIRSAKRLVGSCPSGPWGSRRVARSGAALVFGKARARETLAYSASDTRSSRKTTAAATSSPSVGWSTANVTTCSTTGCSSNTSSSREAELLAAAVMSSFSRP